MTYLDKYPNCNGCPVEQYCGTMVSSTRLCHSYKEPDKEEHSSLALFKAAPTDEEEYVEGQLEMWDNITD